MLEENKYKTYEILENGKKYYYGISDGGFKTLFNHNRNNLILKNIINTIQNIKEIPKISEIKDVKILEQTGSNIRVIKQVIDLIVVTEDDEVINIELNTCYYPELVYRNFGYMTRIYSNQTKKNSSYMENKVIQINLSRGLPKTDPL